VGLFKDVNSVGLLVAVGDVDSCGSRVTKCLYNVDPSKDFIDSHVFFFRKPFWPLNQLSIPSQKTYLRILIFICNAKPEVLIYCTNNVSRSVQSVHQINERELEFELTEQ